VARAPVLRIGKTLVVTVLEDLHDRDALTLQTELLGQLERTAATGVLLDLSVVEIVDSFLGRMLNDIAVGVRLLGAQMVVVGIQPAVAITLVELGLELRGVRTAVNADRGLALLKRLVATAEHRATSQAGFRQISLHGRGRVGLSDADR
jgi:rsbT antagonist protein RsbS